jgi:hypothetical protein
MSRVRRAAGVQRTSFDWSFGLGMGNLFGNPAAGAPHPKVFILPQVLDSGVRFNQAGGPRFFSNWTARAA